MGSRAVEKGQIAKAVAENVEAVRRRRGLTQQQLAGRLAELGRPMQASAVAKVESGERRVDVDDLAALAVALNVPLARLLLPDRESNDRIDVAPAYSAALWQAWEWASGERSLYEVDDSYTDPAVLKRDLDFVDERPSWLRLREQHDISRSVRQLRFAVEQVLRHLPGAPRGRGEEPASGLGVPYSIPLVEKALDRLHGDFEQLKVEVEQRGQHS